MKKLLAFNTVAMDSLSIHADTTLTAGEYELYREYPKLNEDDVTKQGEEEILRWIISSPEGTSLLLQELRVGTDAFVALSVSQPVIERRNFKPGDIDLLICEGDRADLAIGIQCKRVKVTALNQQDDQCNKL